MRTRSTRSVGLANKNPNSLDDNGGTLPKSECSPLVSYSSSSQNVLAECEDCNDSALIAFHSRCAKQVTQAHSGEQCLAHSVVKNQLFRLDISVSRTFVSTFSSREHFRQQLSLEGELLYASNSQRVDYVATNPLKCRWADKQPVQTGNGPFVFRVECRLGILSSQMRGALFKVLLRIGGCSTHQCCLVSPPIIAVSKPYLAVRQEGEAPNRRGGNQRIYSKKNKAKQKILAQKRKVRANEVEGLNNTNTNNIDEVDIYAATKTRKDDENRFKLLRSTRRDVLKLAAEQRRLVTLLEEQKENQQELVETMVHRVLAARADDRRKKELASLSRKKYFHQNVDSILECFEEMSNSRREEALREISNNPRTVETVHLALQSLLAERQEQPPRYNAIPMTMNVENENELQNKVLFHRNESEEFILHTPPRSDVSDDFLSDGKSSMSDTFNWLDSQVIASSPLRLSLPMPEFLGSQAQHQYSSWLDPAEVSSDDFFHD